MTYGKKVMTIGGVRVTDKRAPLLKFGVISCSGCCFFYCGSCALDSMQEANRAEVDAFGAICTKRNAIYIPAPESLRDAYEQTDASAHLTDVEELK